MPHIPEPEAMTRRQLGSIAAPLFPVPWPDALQIATGWNEQTWRRLGRHERFPITARRIKIMADVLDMSEHWPDACQALAAALRDFLERNPVEISERNG